MGQLRISRIPGELPARVEATVVSRQKWGGTLIGAASKGLPSWDIWWRKEAKRKKEEGHAGQQIGET